MHRVSAERNVRMARAGNTRQFKVRLFKALNTFAVIHQTFNAERELVEPLVPW
jgi:hypothetical protein